MTLCEVKHLILDNYREMKINFSFFFFWWLGGGGGGGCKWENKEMIILHEYPHKSEATLFFTHL